MLRSRLRYRWARVRLPTLRHRKKAFWWTSDAHRICRDEVKVENGISTTHLGITPRPIQVPAQRPNFSFHLLLCFPAFYNQFSIMTTPGCLRVCPRWQEAYAASCANRKTSLLYRMPDEITMLIAEYLSPVDALCLSVSCRQTVFLLRLRKYGDNDKRLYTLRKAFDTLVCRLQEKEKEAFEE